MRVFTTYFGNLRNLDKNTVPVAVCQWRPRGWHGDRLAYLAPTEEILTEYRKTNNWKQFVKRYKSEVLDKLDPDEVVADLHECSRGIYDVALVCYEKAPFMCHRSLLANWLMENCNICAREIEVK